MPTCEIKWVDENGNQTPDDNPSIGVVWLPARVEQHHGRGIQYAETQKFNICACHAKQLDKRGMEAWRFEALATA